MIALLQGTVINHDEKSITLLANNIGFRVLVPKPEQFTTNQEVELFTYLHWNQEQGPSLLGFTSELDKKVFLLIIECPKIGPSIGLSILAQIEAQAFLQLVATQNSKGLSQLNGIGQKKAEQIIIELKNKITKIALSIPASDKEDHKYFTMMNELTEVLASLNYSKQEVSNTIAHINKSNKAPNSSFDQLLRSALAFLSDKSA